MLTRLKAKKQTLRRFFSRKKNTLEDLLALAKSSNSRNEIELQIDLLTVYAGCCPYTGVIYKSQLQISVFAPTLLPCMWSTGVGEEKDSLAFLRGYRTEDLDAAVSAVNAVIETIKSTLGDDCSIIITDPIGDRCDSVETLVRRHFETAVAVELQHMFA